MLYDIVERQSLHWKPRSLQACGLAAGCSVGSMYNHPVLVHSTWGSNHHDYVVILTTLISERSPGCQDLRACMSPRVKNMAVTAPQFTESW